MSTKKEIELSAKKILQLIIMKEKECMTAGKDVIIFLGVSQSGKTTTINAFNGARYEIDEDEVLHITNKSFDTSNAGATGGKAGASCSIFPRIFTANDISACL